MRGREDLYELTVAQARSVPLIGAALDAVALQAWSEDEATLLDRSISIRHLALWAMGRFRGCFGEERPSLEYAGALAVLLEVLGVDTFDLWSDHRIAWARRREVRELIAAQHVRVAREAGAL